MFRKEFLWIFVVLFSLSESYWLSFLKSSTNLEDEESTNDRNNETEIDEFYNENNSTINNLFWTTSDLNNTTELTEFQDEENITESTPADIFENDTISEKNDSAITELISPVEADVLPEEIINSEIKVPDTELVTSQMDEEIVLSRSNCNMEIGIDETRDTRILVKFGPIGNPVSGKCCITLNGEQGSVLGVFISDIHLLNNSKEVLKVVINNFGSEFVLKQYSGRSQYQPLLLTETHRVYLVLYYNTTGEIKNNENTHFNLEVFSYRRHESLKQESNYHHSYSPSNSKQNVENIYFTTERPFGSNPYYYGGFY